MKGVAYGRCRIIRGDVWERPALTGDWGGSRSDMADKGVTVSLDLLSTYQSVVDGGKSETDVLGGSIDYEIHMDFQKMGLWPGAFVRLFGETQYGNFVNSSSGAALARDGVSIGKKNHCVRKQGDGFV
jgi:porin